MEPVLTPREAAAHPLHRERGVFFSIPAADGEAIGQVRTPLGARDPAGVSPPPAMGQHSAEILREAGLSDEEIAALRQSGATR